MPRASPHRENKQLHEPSAFADDFDQGRGTQAPSTLCKPSAQRERDGRRAPFLQARALTLVEAASISPSMTQVVVIICAAKRRRRFRDTARARVGA